MRVQSPISAGKKGFYATEAMPLMISVESPFRLISKNIPRRVILRLDGIRLSAEMSWLGFESLRNLLIEVSEKDSGPLGERVVRGLLSAYSVIDW